MVDRKADTLRPGDGAEVRLNQKISNGFKVRARIVRVRVEKVTCRQSEHPNLVVLTVNDSGGQDRFNIGGGTEVVRRLPADEALARQLSLL